MPGSPEVHALALARQLLAALADRPRLLPLAAKLVSALEPCRHSVDFASVRWHGQVYSFSSAMAQNFWIAIFAWTACFLVTIAVSLATRPRPATELEGLVYGLTKLPRDENLDWYRKPAPVAILVIAMLLLLNIWFR